MQLPIDVKAVLDEALDIDEARNTPVSVGVYLDGSAPADLTAHVRSSFASAAAHARITISYLDSGRVTPGEGDDMAVVVAGLSEHAGPVATQLRAAGSPVMVVTTLPQLACALAQEAGSPFPEGDVVFPDGADGVGPEAEPVALDEQAAQKLDTRMGEWIIEACRAKRLALALAFPFVRRPLSLEAVNVTAVQNAGVGLVVFIPGADLPVMTLNQAKMLLQIAAAYGQPMSAERVRELAAVVGGAFAFRTVARELAGVVPGLGWAVKAVVGYTGTLAMGRAAVEYFQNGGGIAGLAGAVAHARDVAVRAAGEARSKAAGAPDLAPEPEPTFAERAAETAQAAGTRAVQAASTVVASAGPLAASAVKSGAKSFAAGASSLLRRR